MYMKRMLEVGKAENGYVVECRVPIKRKDAKDSDMPICHGSSEKQYIADDIDEVAKIIREIMPLMDESFSSEDEFDDAFKKAAKE